MFFTKFPHRANFSYARGYNPSNHRFIAAKRTFTASLDSFEGGVYRLSVDHDDWGVNRSIAELTPPPPCTSQARLEDDLGFRLANEKGEVLLCTPGDNAFGVCGQAWALQFVVGEDARFYGMGEKNFGRLELSGVRTKFWNTDVWADFHINQWLKDVADPPYLSIPYVIVKTRRGYVGILLHTPSPAFFETPKPGQRSGWPAWVDTGATLMVGAECGKPDVWMIVAATLKELTRKLQSLVGRSPLPPLWSLGYHQSRWGYAGERDLLALDKKFEQLGIPCDALWLDIDYMNGFRVFTVDDKLFPHGIQGAAKSLAKNGRKIVAILDPGVKREAGYPVYDDLKKKELECLNPEGEEFVGIVWPGETVYPDFTIKEARDWWAGHVAKLAKDGLAATWVDMNDPSTGTVDPTAMLFKRGTDAHALHRNQYALGMQMATHQGFKQADPKKRTFMLSRSGSVGTSKYAAVWTGDNLSNYFYLKVAIPTSLNLSLSGIPFNGPDVGGFGGTATETLMTDWVKACCLFPFMRNHSSKGTREQEPWQYSAEGSKVIAKFIKLRYKLMPYLYGLCCDHEEHGDPILRPLGYEFEDAKGRFDKVSDQFMVGSSIMQAPLLSSRRSRRVVLPKGGWLDAASGEWLTAASVSVRPSAGETPMYLRNGSIVPLRPGQAERAAYDLRDVDLLVVARPGSKGSVELTLRADDGESTDYLGGKRTEVAITAKWDGSEIRIESKTMRDGYGKMNLNFLLPQGFSKVCVNGASAALIEEGLELAGKPLALLRTKN